jgi:hypothetical protein
MRRRHTVRTYANPIGGGRGGVEHSRRIWYGSLLFFSVVLVASVWLGVTSTRRSAAPAPQATYETVPGISLESIPTSQRKEVLHQLNSTKCTCKCDLTLVQCRNTDPLCDKSLTLVRGVLDRMRLSK